MTNKDLIFLAYLTATASVLHIVESLIFRLLPVPFLRLGLSNAVILYLVWHRRIYSAFVVGIAKSVIGGAVTLTLLSPAIALSLGGTIAALSIMSLGLLMRPRFSITGISILGAISHNIAQLSLARLLIITKDSLFVLTPILLLLALLSGIVTAYICYYLEDKIPGLKAQI